MTWTVNRVQAPGTIWARYADAFGIEELKATFGDHWPPAQGRSGEEVYCWRDMDANPRPFDPSDHPASWLSLSRDQMDPTTAYMSRGVWPDQHGKNIGRLMRDWAEDWAREHDVTSIQISVYAVNFQHLAKVLKDPYWTLEGVFFNPPAFSFSHAVGPKSETITTEFTLE